MRLIDADALKCAIKWSGVIAAITKEIIDEQPTVDAVPVKSIEQLKWERDTAIQQLEEHGIPFCGKGKTMQITLTDEESTLNYDGMDDKPTLEDEERVNHPTHYLGSIECIDAIEAAIECLYDPVDGFLIGNIIKYVWRWQDKGGVEDLKKARWYLDRIIERESKER